ncbi:MAG: hypothetical protein PHI97_32390 [Desulfobulbus sp.]|nr:hypothetical protein [Desulfobulbus sp.]
MSIENRVENEMAPIFLELGKAVHTCQLLEVKIRALNAQLSQEEVEEEGMFGAALDFYSNETLGQSINALRKRIDIPANLSDYLEAGLKIRNEIVHDSLTRNTERFTHAKGRLEVLSELAFMENEVNKRNVLINKLLDALFAKGKNAAECKRNTDQLWADINVV